MCILFAYLNNNPSADGYQVVIALNRDEYFIRPTKPAHFWNNGTCISGTDNEPGREGGTWFGTSVTGRIGALLNIAQQNLKQDGLGRGHLVCDFLTSNDDSATYATRLMSHGEDYNGFNLLLIDKLKSEWRVHYCCNTVPDNERYRRLELPSDGILALSNSSFDRPWCKVTSGRERFKEILTQYGSTAQSEALKSSLISLLDDRTSHLPDPVLESVNMGGRFNDPEVVAARSAVFVDLKGKFPYGTRTHTLLLIDSKGSGDFIEQTMREPIDMSNIQWDTTRLSFNLTTTSVGPGGANL